jgi:NAD(P)H-hydrate epimerase
MRRIDDITIREFQVDVVILMENAGRAIATMARQMLEGTIIGKRVACLVGGGNNGGDGMVAARHLANWGADVEVIVGTTKDRMKSVPLGQLHILEKIGTPILSTDYVLRDYDLLIDGLIGYGLEGNPRDIVAMIIKDANVSGRPILALDIPSGMNATSGEAYDPCIKATATLTLALPKTGFLAPSASPYVGDLYLADISIPRKVYQSFGQQNILFQDDTIMKIM